MVMATSHSLFSFFFLMVFFIQVSSKSYYHYYYHYPSFHHSHSHFRLRPHPPPPPSHLPFPSPPPPLFRLNSWKLAHATFYGDMQGGETMQGACGYGDLFQQGYGLETTALSTALFNNGLTCGACFEIQCVNDPQWCIEGAGTIKVTATNFCPPNYDAPNFDHWCNPPQEHFDLSMKMFTQMAIYKAGIIPVQYRRVPCTKTGGVRFEIKGNPYWLLVLIYNVGNAGDVCQVSIKGSQGNWVPMTRSWGQNWLTGFNLVGQCMSFMVTTSDGKTLEFDNVVPSDWQFGQTHEAGTNF